MDDSNTGTPPEIIIRVDNTLAYAWNSAGDCIGRRGLRMIAECFPGHPALPDLVSLEYELWAWSARQPGDTPSIWQWREFHLRGLVLTHRLADLLRGSSTIFYHTGKGNPSLQKLELGPL